jgi:SAM-dependent methyltransferase
MSSPRAFEAPDLIEVMEEAVNYNRFLIEQLLAWSRGLERVLDFGAGNGRFASALREKEVEVHAVEPDPDLGRKIAASGVPTYESLEAAGEQCFSGVYTINVLEHLENDRAFLDGFHRCLKPGGRLFVYVPAFPVLFSANDTRVGHVRRYGKATLVGRIRDAGFAIEHVSFVDSLGFFAGLGYRFFGDKNGGLDVRSVRLYDRALFPVSRLVDRGFGRILGKNLLVRASRPRRD